MTCKGHHTLHPSAHYAHSVSMYISMYT